MFASLLHEQYTNHLLSEIWILTPSSFKLVETSAGQRAPVIATTTWDLLAGPRSTARALRSPTPTRRSLQPSTSVSSCAPPQSSLPIVQVLLLLQLRLAVSHKVGTQAETDQRLVVCYIELTIFFFVADKVVGNTAGALYCYSTIGTVSGNS